MIIGPYKLKNNIFLAPMAGITDSPFRRLCLEMGAGLATSEMILANPSLLNTEKTRRRLQAPSEQSPHVVQILGADPARMAETARFNVDQGADMIDINMGCPSRKVARTMAGAALLRNEALVARILHSVVSAVAVPVTVKIRTGWDKANRNALRIARIAESSGIQAVTVHGRTRACGFHGDAEHHTAAEIKSMLSIPVIANGDITTPQQAASVLGTTGVDAIMIGRAALGNPWIFREINHFLATGRILDRPGMTETGNTLLRHVNKLHEFYGDYTGVRMARKHIAWYMRKRMYSGTFLSLINRVDTTHQQRRLIQDYFLEQRELAA